MTSGIFVINTNIILALVLTIILEFIVYAIWFRKDFLKVASYCILINLLTVPLANLFYGILFLSQNPWVILIIEIMVILVEILLIALLFNMKYWKALILSFIANLISTILGLVIIVLLGMNTILV